ncbi:MAG: efflux RND transporter permease subunit [Deltaproteobacteria bacterium]|nr:efflux RND transporter permease subunit [Deltaproteobacteria bacterium]
MIEWIIERSLRNKFLVVVLAGTLVAAGVWALSTTPVDAIPDLSDVQVIVFTEHKGQAPQVVEDQVTYPLTTAMLSVPHAKNVRGYSFFGFSLVYVIFEDGTDIYWARSRVLEYLNFVQGRLPTGVTPQLGPDATGVGWVFQYALVSEKHDLAQLRSIQDWYLRYELMALPGVAEVASLGGFVKQYQVEVDPERLRAYNIPLAKVKRAIVRSNMDVGGRLLEMAESEFMVRGKGYFKSVDDLKNVPVGVDNKSHTPILLAQVANVQLGPEIRRGIAEIDGRGEAVAGIVVMRFGENALKVIERVKQRLEQLKSGLPPGVEIKVSYDRSKLILRAIKTLISKLVEELGVVALICIIFLLHFRSALVAIITVPLGILAALLLMRLLGISANIMSLGGIAIAIGVMVDASIVMVENLHKHFEGAGGQRPLMSISDDTRLELVLRAAKEVGPALFFSLLIITVSFLPVFSLQQQAGRLFAPLAYTKTFAMAAASILAITIIPVLMYYFVRGRMRSEQSNPLSRFFIWAYRPLIKQVLRFPRATVILSAALVVATIVPWSKVGSEFMPPLNEGDLLYMPTTPPGLSITKAKELLQQTDKIIAAHPQVAHVSGKIGRAETATDPAPLSMIETTIILKERSSWPAGKTLKQIVAELDAMVQFPGLTNAWTMPIKTRIDMLATGIKTPLGIKLMGADLEQLSRLGGQIEAVLRTLPDTLSAYAERATGGNFIDIDVRRTEAARFGLTVGDVQDVIKSALGGMNVTHTVEGLERYPVNVRFPRELRDDLQKLHRIPVPTPMGHTVPLGQIADISVKKGPPAIKSENARRTAWIFVDLRTSDIGGYVKRAKAEVESRVKFPPGVSVIWSGQWEYMQRVSEALWKVIPLTLVIVFMLLYLHFRSIAKSCIVMLTLPFALVGGVWLIWGLDYNVSAAAAVGFIALAGLAAETGVVMLVYLDRALDDAQAAGQLSNAAQLRVAITVGAVERVRPKLMTVATTLIGLLPVMYGTETGARVMKRIAAPMVGGLLSSAVLTLVIVPALYYLYRYRKLQSTGPAVNENL